MSSLISRGLSHERFLVRFAASVVTISAGLVGIVALFGTIFGLMFAANHFLTVGDYASLAKMVGALVVLASVVLSAIPPR